MLYTNLEAACMCVVPSHVVFFHIYMKWSNLLDETGPLTRSGERKLSIRARQDSVGCAAKTSSAAAL